MLRHCLFPALVLFCALLLSAFMLLAGGALGPTKAAGVTALPRGNRLAVLSAAVTTTIAPEIDGLAGPAPVNCSAATYLTAQTALDQQRADWVAATAATLPGAVALPAWISGPSGAAVSAPYLITQPDGFAMTITPVDLAPGWGFQSGSAATGVPARLF